MDEKVIESYKVQQLLSLLVTGKKAQFSRTRVLLLTNLISNNKNKKIS